MTTKIDITLDWRPSWAEAKHVGRTHEHRYLGPGLVRRDHRRCPRRDLLGQGVPQPKLCPDCHLEHAVFGDSGASGRGRSVELPDPEAATLA